MAFCALTAPARLPFGGLRWRQSRKKPRTNLGQVVGSMEDIKTNQDFNNEHPEHDENGLKEANLEVEVNSMEIKAIEKLVLYTYRVFGMSCANCVETVKNKLSFVDGVISVQVDLKKNEVKITSAQSIKIDKLKEALSKTGYTISEF